MYFMKLETERLILRKPRMSDVEDLVEGMNNLNVSKNLVPVPYPYKKKDAKDFVNKKIEEWSKRKKKDYLFFIELKSEKKVIGAIGLHKVDEFAGIATTGSWISEKYWKKGYITEAKIIVNEFAFDKLKLRRLNSEVFADNVASNKTQQKMGYELEGIMRESDRSLATEKIHNTNFYGLLKSDWKKKVSKLKRELREKIKKLGK